jgi:hypothetical protein
MSDFENSIPPQPEPGARGNPPRPPKITARALEDDPEWRGSIIDEIEKRLVRYPEARVERTSCCIRCLPSHPDEFVVGLRVKETVNDDRHSVFCGPSCLEFSSRGAAVTAFGYGISNGCRLKEYSRQGRAYRWITEIQRFQNDWMLVWDFMPWSTAVLQFWSRPTIRYLQNGLIDLRDDGLSSAA